MPIPLSLSQELILHTAPILVSVAFELPERHDLTALSRALELVVSRHEALRMRLRTAMDGSVTQDFLAADGLVPLVDRHVTSVPEAVARLANETLDLTREPAVRATLLRAEGAPPVFMVQVHHMAVDGWGFGRFIDELRRSYVALRDGTPLTLPALPLSYTDYVRQEAEAGAALTSEQLAYWSEQLSECTPYEFPQSSAMPRTGAREVVRPTGVVPLDSESTAKLVDFARRSRVTVPSLVMAALAITAMVRHGQRDLLLKTTHLGRDVAGTMNMVACFTYSSFLRVRLDETTPAAELVRRSGQVWLESMSYSVPPFTIGRMLRHMLTNGQADMEMVRRLGRAVTLNYFNHGDETALGAAAGDGDQLGRPVRVPREYSAANDTMPVLVEARLGDTLNLSGLCNPERYHPDSVVDFCSHVSASLASLASLAGSQPDIPAGALAGDTRESADLP